MTEGDVQHDSSRTHDQNEALTDGTIVDTRILSEGQKFKPGQSLWMWWIGDLFCLTDHDKKQMNIISTLFNVLHKVV